LHHRDPANSGQSKFDDLSKYKMYKKKSFINKLNDDPRVDALVYLQLRWG